MISRSRSRVGSTLLECVASIVILGTGLVAGISLFGMHETVVAQEAAVAGASRHLRAEIEKQRTVPFDRLKSFTAQPVEGDPTYSVSSSVVVVESDVVSVTSIITWTSLSGVRQKISATSLRCRGAD